MLKIAYIATYVIILPYKSQNFRARMRFMITPPFTWIEISASAFEHNIKTFRALISPESHLGVVVKSNAYGHGIQEIGLMCEQLNDVQWLFTTSLSEALTLRACGVTKPILALCLIDDDPAQAIHNNIDVMAYQIPTLNQLNATAQKCSKKIAVHIKVDTGMSRFGVYRNEVFDVIRHAQNLPFINLRGLYTHFSESDNDDQKFTQGQLDQFKILVADLECSGIQIPVKHAGNSAAAAALPGSHCDVIRLGAGAYGFWPSEFIQRQAGERVAHASLKPVMQWKAKLLEIRVLPAESSVGYRRSFKTKAPTALGIVPVGYYEGYDRRLSNKGIILINGKTAPIIGRICMNVCMVDLTGIDAQPGDEVILLGNHPVVSAQGIATVIESFNPREITTRINPAVKRIVVP